MPPENAYACKICVATKGLTLKSPWIFDTMDELADHVLTEHAGQNPPRKPPPADPKDRYWEGHRDGVADERARQEADKDD